MAKQQVPQEAAVKIVWVPIDKVLPNPNNPRTISDKKIEELMQSMTDLPEMVEFRFLVVDRYTGFLLGGNQRHTAMKRLGYTTVPVAYSDEMSEAQKQEFIIRDNIEAGFWDNEKLDFEFRDFPLVQWGIIEGVLPAESRAHDKSTVADAKIIYDNAEMKQVVVYFDATTHADISNQLEKIRDENYFGDNAEVLLFLIENYAAEKE